MALAKQETAGLIHPLTKYRPAASKMSQLVIRFDEQCPLNSGLAHWRITQRPHEGRSEGPVLFKLSCFEENRHQLPSERLA